MFVPYNPSIEIDQLRKVYGNEWVQSCAIEEFFRKEEEKPPWLRSGVCMMTCNCPKCRVIC